MGSSMFDAGYEAGRRDALAEVRRFVSRKRHRNPPVAKPRCAHPESVEGRLWRCNVCGETGGDITPAPPKE